MYFRKAQDFLSFGSQGMYPTCITHYYTVMKYHLIS